MPRPGFVLFLLLLLPAFRVAGQTLSSLREKPIQANSDTLVLDSLSIVPGSFIFSATAPK